MANEEQQTQELTPEIALNYLFNKAYTAITNEPAGPYAENCKSCYEFLLKELNKLQIIEDKKNENQEETGSN